MTTEAVPDLASLLSQSVVHPLPPSQVELYLSRAPFVPLQGIVNFRTLTSPTIPPNLIYRFGALSLAPALTLAQLLTTYNIRTIYDLRSAAEREEAPSPVIRGVETVWIPNTADGTVYLKDENGEQRKKDVPEDVPKELFAEGDGVKAWIRKYGDILDMHGHIYKAVFERLRDGDQGAILFHCTGLLFCLLILTFSPLMKFLLS